MRAKKKEREDEKCVVFRISPNRCCQRISVFKSATSPTLACTLFVRYEKKSLSYRICGRDDVERKRMSSFGASTIIFLCHSIRLSNAPLTRANCVRVARCSMKKVFAQRREG